MYAIRSYYVLDALPLLVGQHRYLVAELLVLALGRRDALVHLLLERAVVELEEAVLVAVALESAQVERTQEQVEFDLLEQLVV